VPERPNGAVLKTVGRASVPWVQIPPPPLRLFKEPLEETGRFAPGGVGNGEKVQADPSARSLIRSAARPRALGAPRFQWLRLRRRHICRRSPASAVCLAAVGKLEAATDPGGITSMRRPLPDFQPRVSASERRR
jgi:hypothetical protein